MASILKVNTLTGVTAAGTIAVTAEGGTVTTNLQQGLGKSWLQHNQSHAIQDSFNFTSITDGGTGITNDATFTNVLASDNYAISGLPGSTTNDDGFWAILAIATTDFNVRCRTHNGNLNDSNNASLIVHGDLA